jgi:hypothetical protein
MEKIVGLLVAFVAFGLLTSVSHATCVASGEISRISVNPDGVFSSFYVITSTPQRPSYAYFTTDIKIVNAALTAQASHMTITATGSVASCPSPSGGIINGGTVITLTTAP